MLRFLAVMVMLATTVAAIAIRRYNPPLAPKSEKLANFPMIMGEWAGKDVPLDPEVVRMLGTNGDYLTRVYFSTHAAAWVNLYIAYFGRSFSGEGIHSPKNCLPGSGWSFLDSSYMTMQVPGRPSWQVGRYVIANGSARQLVLYWYHAGGRKYASEYAGKLYFITDSIRSNRTDAALVRIVTPINSGETPGSAEARAVSFIREIGPTLPRFVPD
jgi:EpsI family protein